MIIAFNLFQFACITNTTIGSDGPKEKQGTHKEKEVRCHNAPEKTL